MSNLDKYRPRRPPNSRFRKLNPIFHLQNQESDSKELSSHLIKLARKSGQLSLSGRGLASVPEKVWQLDELDEAEVRLLEVRMDREVEGERWWEHEPLTWLDLSSNCITQISPKIKNLATLTVLNIHNNNLDSIPSELGCLTKLTRLNISHNKLTALPLSFFKLCELRSLQLSHNHLEVISDDIGDLVMLENLEIDVEILEGLSRLRVLNLRDNKLELIPEEISSLQLLTRFDLTNNCLSTLPDIVGFLPHLQSLQLDGNPLRSIRRDIIQCGTSRILKFLRERCKGEGNITVGSESNFTSSAEVKFPDRYMMRNGRALSLAMQDLTEIPDSVFLDAVEAEVTSVDISKNKLKEVPLGLKNLASRITDLNVSCNLLTMISLELGLCQNLQYLDLQKNLLEDLPQSFECLTRLRELVIAFNKFSELPECVYKLPGLEILIARGNQLTKIDISGLSQLKRLATLDLADNNINHVPPELGNMTQLRCLELTGNSFRQPRHAILMKGTVSILSYLRDRIPQDQ